MTGPAFHGFAAQQGQRTVAGSLMPRHSSEWPRHPARRSRCAGRTDAGVHASDQVVHVDLPAEVADRLDPVRRGQLVQRASWDRPSWSARPDRRPTGIRRPTLGAPPAGTATSCSMRRSRSTPGRVGLARRRPPRSAVLAAASDALLGEHDFRAFCRRVPGTSPAEPITRRVLDARWSRIDEPPGPSRLRWRASLLRLRDRGQRLLPPDGPLHRRHPRRRGTWPQRPSDLPWILRSADRQQASQPAPPHGLSLVAVRYPEAGLPPGPVSSYPGQSPVWTLAVSVAGGEPTGRLEGCTNPGH